MTTINYGEFNWKPLDGRASIYGGHLAFSKVMDCVNEAKERIVSGEGRLISTMMDDAMDAWVQADSEPEHRWRLIFAEIELIYRAALRAEKEATGA